MLQLLILCASVLPFAQSRGENCDSQSCASTITADVLLQTGRRVAKFASIKRLDADKCIEAVVVEPRKIASIAVTLESAAEVQVCDQNSTRIDVLTIAHGNHNRDYVRELIRSNSVLSKEEGGRLRYLDLAVGDLGGDFLQKSNSSNDSVSLLQYHDKYSRLLKRSDFWNSFLCDRILLMQSDSVLCRNSLVRLSEFLEYEYVGGHSPGMGGAEYGGRLHINGGLSFRNRNAMLRCLQGNPPDIGPEDTFFSTCKDIQQPPVDVLDRFAIDNGLKDIGNSTVPLGVHKPWAFHAEFPFSASNMLHCEGARELKLAASKT